MLAEYKRIENHKMISKFEKYPIMESKAIYDEYCISGLRDQAMHELGVGITKDMKSVISGIFFKSLRCRAYTISERINLWRGKAASHSFPVTADAFSFDAFESVPTIDVPIYFKIRRIAQSMKTLRRRKRFFV